MIRMTMVSSDWQGEGGQEGGPIGEVLVVAADGIGIRSDRCFASVGRLGLVAVINGGSRCRRQEIRGAYANFQHSPLLG
jgi:hypothetical protein